MRRSLPLLALCAAAAVVMPGYSAYEGHAGDRDIEAVLASYPSLKGAPADSCATCHLSGDVNAPPGSRGLRTTNHCDYCHAVFVRDKHDVRQTLNRYGAAYLAAGRGVSAVRALAAEDSDGDGFSNDVEFRRGTDPGDAASNPAAAVAPSRTYTIADLRGLSPIIEQTVFFDTTKNKSGDAYNEYRGNAAWAVLQAVGMLETATSVDFLSADGYEQTFTVDELRKAWPQAPPVMGLGTRDLGACGWVRYNARGLDAAKPLPAATIMLAFEQNGTALGKDPQTGRLEGTGPLRLIVPQFQVSPPDLPQTAAPSCGPRVALAYRFHEDYDHNGGKSSFALVAVRLKPLPKGTRDVDWQTPALQYLANGQIVFFGALEEPGSR